MQPRAEFSFLWGHSLSLGLLPFPDRNRHVANFDATGLELEPILVTVPARFNQVFKKGRVRAQDLQVSAFVQRDICGHANGLDGNSLFGLFIEAQRARAAWQCRQEFYPLHHATQQSYVAIEVPRRMANDDVELGASAAVGRGIPSSANHAVTMDQPYPAALRIARNGK